MNKTPSPGATDKTQAPCTHDELIRLLEKLGITHSTVSHEPMFTVTDSKKLRATDPSGGYTKNLFLRNKKGLMWLVTCNEDRQIDLRSLAQALDYLAALRPGAAIVDLSTNSIAGVRARAAECRAAGIDFLDAPVSGGIRS